MDSEEEKRKFYAHSKENETLDKWQTIDRLYFQCASIN